MRAFSMRRGPHEYAGHACHRWRELCRRVYSPGWWSWQPEVLPFRIPVAVAASTLAAALFNPLRRRVQRIVDRRFNRARYDADRLVATFAARLKAAVELDSIRDDLTGVVHQALEPAHVSVWIGQRY